MPVGAGFSSVGVSIAGYGGVDAGPVQQQTILIDATDGSNQNARKVDPYTGQYVLDQYGRVQGMSGIQQMVMMRAGTLLDSSAVTDLGLAPPPPTAIPGIEMTLKNQLTAAMKDLVDQKLIEITRVEVFKAPGSTVVQRFMFWRDLTVTGANAGIEQRTSF